MSTKSGKEQKTVNQIQEETSKRNNRNNRNKHFQEKRSANNIYIILVKCLIN